MPIFFTQSSRKAKQFTARTDPVNVVAFSLDGKTELTRACDRKARLGKVEAGKGIKQLTRHEGSISSGAFSAGGKTVLTGSDYATARLWNAKTGKRLQHFSDYIDSAPMAKSVAFSSDGTLISV